MNEFIGCNARSESPIQREGRKHLKTIKSAPSVVKAPLSLMILLEPVGKTRKGLFEISILIYRPFLVSPKGSSKIIKESGALTTLGALLIVFRY